MCTLADERGKLHVYLLAPRSVAGPSESAIGSPELDGPAARPNPLDSLSMGKWTTPNVYNVCWLNREEIKQFVQQRHFVSYIYHK